jgi:hypothetical protein
MPIACDDSLGTEVAAATSVKSVLQLLITVVFYMRRGKRRVEIPEEQLPEFPYGWNGRVGLID